jgi:hypothetical protein
MRNICLIEANRGMDLVEIAAKEADGQAALKKAAYLSCA